MSKERVVCIKIEDYQHDGIPKLILGEIYTPISGSLYPDRICLAEFGTGFCYRIRQFRPVDDSFGEYVESTLMKEAELEEVLSPISL